VVIRLVLAEDQRVLREALVALLEMEHDLKVVGVAERGQEAAQLAVSMSPDVLILDIGLPDVSGLAVAARVRAQLPEIRILMLTSLDRPGVVREALTLGVNGFLPKGVAAADLVAAIRDVHAGKRVVSPDLVSAALSAGENPLTPRERSILRLAATGTPPPQIATQLHLAEGTVRNYITRIIAKLSARNSTDAIRIAKYYGWL
jgi:two-component system response regulator DesR